MIYKVHNLKNMSNMYQTYTTKYCRTGLILSDI